MVVEDLEAYGMSRMDDGEIEGFLASQTVGILGLPADGAPAMRPLSFWYDGGSRLYFVYVLTTDSRKVALTDRTDAARFLVYRVDTPFNWTSVLLTGTIHAVPEDERAAIEADMEVRWRPDALERASEERATRLYRFEIDERVGLRHNGLPPGFEPDRE